MAIVGIDLGNTYSCIKVWHNDRVKIIVNDQGNRITPFCVAFMETEHIFGDVAKVQTAINPSNMVSSVKSLMYRKFSEFIFDAQCRLTVISGPVGCPIIEIEYKGEKQQFTPEEISSMVLAKIRGIAETYLERRLRTLSSLFRPLQ